MTPVSHGKPCAGNPHARFEEGASASEEPRRNALLHNKNIINCKKGEFVPGRALRPRGCGGGWPPPLAFAPSPRRFPAPAVGSAGSGGS